MVLLKALTYIETLQAHLPAVLIQNVGIMNSCFLLLQQLLVLLLLDAVMYYCTDIIISQNVCYDWSISWPHFIAWHAKLKCLLELKSFPSIWT